MKVQIRHGVFETNSSSTHSVTVDPAEAVDFGLSKEVLRAGVIELRPAQYGWSWKRYRTPQGKMEYLLAQVCASVINSQPKGKDCTAAVAKNANARMMFDAVRKATGCEVAVFAPKGRDTVHVDGDSHGVGFELFASKKDLLGFIFSPNAYVQTGNDNYTAGEFILNDLGQKEEFCSGHYAQQADVPDGVPFSIVTDGWFKKVELSSSDDKCEAVFGWGGSADFIAALDGAVCTSATIALENRANGKDHPQEARDLLHEFLAHASLGEGRGLLVAREANVTLVEGRGRGSSFYGDVTFKIDAVAPAKTVEALFLAAWQAPKSKVPSP